jgi:hypothetical protein
MRAGMVALAVTNILKGTGGTKWMTLSERHTDLHVDFA